MVLQNLGWCVKNAIPLDSDEFQYHKPLLNRFFLNVPTHEPELDTLWVIGPFIHAEAYNRTVTEQAEMPLGRPNQ